VDGEGSDGGVLVSGGDELGAGSAWVLDCWEALSSGLLGVA
jgi:hypothetical protein